MSEEVVDDSLFSGTSSIAPGIGEVLKTAREAKGMSVQEAGTRLRLMARQIEAMEAEDFASLGQPVFGRGFVRNYARMLGLDEEPLLAQMSPAKAVVVPETESLPFTPKPGFWTSPWVMSSVGAVILILAVPIALYFWLNSGEEELAPTQTATQAVQAPPAVHAVPDASPEGLPNMQANTAVPSGVSLPGAMEPAQTPSVPLVPTVQLQPQAPQMPAAKPGASSPGSAEMQSIQFRLAQPAWLQVRDSTGKMVHSALNLAGSSVEVKGIPPFSLVVGNAAQVQLTYKNKPVDIKPYIDVTVARFTLD